MFYTAGLPGSFLRLSHRRVVAAAAKIAKSKRKRSKEKVKTENAKTEKAEIEKVNTETPAGAMAWVGIR